MLLIIKFLAKTLSALNSEVSPSQIAAGFAYGALIGLVPVAGLLPLILLFLGLIVNINLAIMFVAAGIFKIVSFGLDPVANQLGFFFLTKVDPLKGLWTTIYNAPVLPYANLNNTIVLGSVVLGILLFIPLFILARLGVRNYRTSWKDKILKTKLVQALKASTFYKYYAAYRSFAGD